MSHIRFRRIRCAMDENEENEENVENYSNKMYISRFRRLK